MLNFTTDKREGFMIEVTVLVKAHWKELQNAGRAIQLLDGKWCVVSSVQCFCDVIFESEAEAIRYIEDRYTAYYERHHAKRLQTAA